MLLWKMKTTGATVFLRCLILMSALFTSSYQCPVPCECDTITNTIDCSSRNLTSVPEFRIIPLSRIEVLDLSGNNLSVLNSSDFRNLLGLLIDTIDVSSNRISRVVGEFSDGNEAIGYKTLNISNNLLEDFPKNIIPNVHQRAALVIDISNNFLEELPGGIFADADSFYPGLEFFARGNQIRAIHPDAFGGPTITDAILDFRNNNLSSIPEELKLPLGVRSIQLSDNPWSCDCTLRWISGSLLGNFSEASSPICNTPKGVEGRPLFSLSRPEFACAPSVVAADVRMFSEFGGNLLLRCPVSSDPPNPQTTWKVIQPDGTANPWTIEVTATQLNVTHIKSSEVIYRCTASNSAGSVTVDLRINLTTSGEEEENTSASTGEKPVEVVTEIYKEIVTFMEDDSSSRDPDQGNRPTENQPESTTEGGICVSQSTLVISLIVVASLIFILVATMIATVWFWRYLLPNERKRKFKIRSTTERADFAFHGPEFYTREGEVTGQSYVSEFSTPL